MKEVLIKGEGLKKQRECVEKESWRLFCPGHPLGDVPGGNM